jgi:hypothetical protein
MVTFVKVKEQHENIIIVGSSPEAQSYYKHKDWTTIAVNGAIDICKNDADYWFTLDPGSENLERMLNRHRYPNTIFYAAVPETIETSEAPVPYMRRKFPKNIRYLKRSTIDCGLSKDKGIIHTGNSAFGALGLAYHMGAKNVILLGVNGDSGKRFDGSNCARSIEHLPKLFESAVYNDQMTIYNGNINSKIECFPKFDFTIEGYLGINCLQMDLECI